MASKNLYDVVVVGGGPVGSQVAFRMAGMGYRTAVLEKKLDLSGQVCCTGIVSIECARHFDIPDSVIHRTANGACIFSPSGNMLDLKRKQPQVAILNRPAFNALWAQRAQDKGAEYLFHHEVRAIDASGKSANIAALRHGETVNLQARVVVLAAGFGTQLMDKLDIGGVGDFVMGAQAEVETKGECGVEVYAGSKFAPGFFTWLVPTAPGKALAGLLSRRYPPAYLRTFLARLHAEGRIVSADVHVTHGGVPLKALRRTYADRLLVVGTAAGQIKPLTGGGIYFGLLSADNAANALSRCLLQDDLSAVRLATYQRNWKRKLQREIRVGYWARRLYERLNDGQIDHAFRLLEANDLLDEIAASDKFSFDWHADVISRIFSQRTFVKALRSMKLPFGLRERVEIDVVKKG